MKLSTKILAVAFVVAIALVVAIPASAAGFTQNLTVGSTGAEVTQLQTVLGVTPVTGYFGPITKAAVIKYQVANAIPGTGYVGPLTRGALNGAAPVGNFPAGCSSATGYSTTTGLPCSTTATLPAGCVAGALFSSTTGVPCTATTPVVNNGVEGTLSVTQSNAGLPSSIYEGNTQVGVLSFKVEAKNSNITVQRVKVELGSVSSIYNKRFSKIYVTEGSNVLASSDLNSNTVVKESDGTYTITLTGMNLVVPKDGTKVVTIKVDVFPSVDSTYRSVASTFRLATDGVRGVDGAGLNQYAGGTSITRTISTISTDLVDAANLKLSLDVNTPKATQIIASAGTLRDEADKVPVLIFDLKADKDDVTVTDLVASVTGTAAVNGNVTTVYLFDGSRELANASLSAGVATFSDISDLVISKDATARLTIKVDIRNATGTKTVIAAVATSQVTAENSNGDALVSGSTITGSTATSNTINVAKSGAEVTLQTKTAEKSVETSEASSTLTAVFTYRVTANGADVILGTTGSSTPFASSSAFTVYKNGALIAQSASPTITAVSYEMPDGVVDNGGNTFTISDGTYADIPVTVKVTYSTRTDTISVQTAALNVNNSLLTFMNGQSAWRSTAK